MQTNQQTNRKNRSANQSSTSKSSNTEGFLLPSSTDLEESVLGAILCESDAYKEIEGWLTENDFYREQNATVFLAARRLAFKREPIDMLTVTEELRRSGDLETVGGPLYIAQLTEKVGSAGHLQYHTMIIKQKSAERMLIQVSQEATRRILVECEDIDDVMAWQTKEIEKLQEGLVGKQETQHISDAVKKSLSEMYKRMENAKLGKQTGINTGLRKLNKKTNGWQNSDLIIIAARPAMGKTAFALHFAKSAAIDGTPVAVFSLEMSDVSLTNRWLLSECDVDPELFKSGKLTPEQAAEFERAGGALWNLPIYIDDNSGVSMTYIRSKARMLKRKGKCGLIVIDYLQLAEDSNDNRNRNREQEVAKMSKEAKRIAKELNIPVLLLSQLSREVEKRSDKRPMLSDLRESGAIEQDADMVCFIHRPDYYGKELELKSGTVENGIEFIIAKYRNGSTGCVVAQHDGTLNNIFDYEDTSFAPQSAGYSKKTKQVAAIEPDNDDLPF